MTFTLETFKATLDENLPPLGISIHLKALWYDAKGDWHQAHKLIDQLDDPRSAHVHAYLHRKEGDLWNARYWYNRAKQTMPEKTLEEEWTDLFHQLR